MNLATYLTQDRVLILKAKTKPEVLSELADELGKADLGVTADELNQAIMKREALMSTGIGQGFAVPHARLEGAKSAGVAVGVSHEGIADYESLDNQPVHLIVMIIAPQGEHETYLRLLAEIARKVKDPQLRAEILNETDPAAIYATLMEA